MHSILIIVEKPMSHSRNPSNNPWEAFLDAAQQISSSTQGLEVLGQAVYLLTLEKSSSLKTFHDLVHAADHRGLKYRALFFEDSPTWVYSCETP